MPIHTATIIPFLTKWETSQTEGYIPHTKRNFTGRNDLARCGEVIASSGVTIGTGVDLGQQNEKGLRDMGVPDALVDRFRPYLGISRGAAVVALLHTPLRISVAECVALDAAVHTSYIRKAAAAYDRASAFSFEAIPAEAQTVIVSLFYQLGHNSRYPKTWAPLIAGDWAGAAHELTTGFTKYANRRKDEGRLLTSISADSSRAMRSGFMRIVQ